MRKKPPNVNSVFLFFQRPWSRELQSMPLLFESWYARFLVMALTLSHIVVDEKRAKYQRLLLCRNIYIGVLDVKNQYVTIFRECIRNQVTRAFIQYSFLPHMRGPISNINENIPQPRINFRHFTYPPGTRQHAQGLAAASRQHTRRRGYGNENPSSDAHGFRPWCRHEIATTARCDHRN